MSEPDGPESPDKSQDDTPTPPDKPQPPEEGVVAISEQLRVKILKALKP